MVMTQGEDTLNKADRAASPPPQPNAPRPLGRWQRVLLVSYVLYGLLGFVNAVFIGAAPMIWTVETSLRGRIVVVIASALAGLLVLRTAPSFKRCLERCRRVTSNTDKWLTEEECAQIADPSDWGGKQPTAEQFNAGFIILPIVTALIPLAVALDVLMLIETVFQAIETGTVDTSQASMYIYPALLVPGFAVQLGRKRRAMPRDKVNNEPVETAS